MIIPNNQSLRSIAAGLLWLPHLFTPLRVSILRDTDLRRSLCGLAPLCAKGGHVSFTNTTATVSHNGNIVLSGHRLDPQLLRTFNLPAALGQTTHLTLHLFALRMPPLAALQIRRSYGPSMQAISILSGDLQLGFCHCILPNQLPQQKDI